MWPPSTASNSMTMGPEPVTDDRALWFVVASVHPGGTTVLKAFALKGCGVDPPDGEMLDDGVTVVPGEPHAVSISNPAAAHAARARVQSERGITQSRIAEVSGLSSLRSGHNPTHGH